MGISLSKTVSSPSHPNSSVFSARECLDLVFSTTGLILVLYFYAECSRIMEFWPTVLWYRAPHVAALYSDVTGLSIDSYSAIILRLVLERLSSLAAVASLPLLIVFCASRALSSPLVACLARSLRSRASSGVVKQITLGLKLNEDANSIHPLEATFDELLSTSYEVYLLQGSLSNALDTSQFHQSHSKRLESLLAQEQHKSALATRGLKQYLRRHWFLYTDPNDNGSGNLARGGKIMMTRGQILGLGIYALGLTYKLVRMLGRKLADKTLAVIHLREDLTALKSKHQDLLFANTVLKSQVISLTAQASTAAATQTTLSRKLMHLHIQHTASLQARQKAAQGMIEMRDKMAKEQKIESERVNGILNGLRKYATSTGEQLKENARKAEEMQKELNEEVKKRQSMEGALRVASGNNAVLGGELTHVRGQVKQLEEQLRRQTADLAEMRAARETLRVAHEESTHRLSRTMDDLQGSRAILTELTAKNVSLASSHASVSSLLQDTLSKLASLQTEHSQTIRATGISLALFARHADQERRRVEEEKVRDMEPVREFMRDIRMRVARADRYILNQLEPTCETPERAGNGGNDGAKGMGRGFMPTPPSSDVQPSRLSREKDDERDSDPFSIPQTAPRPRHNGVASPELLQAAVSYTMLAQLMGETPETPRSLFHSTTA